MKNLLSPRPRTINCRIKGGFGNQLFQLATVVNFALNSGAVFILSPQPGTREFALDKLGLLPNVSYMPLVADGKLSFLTIPTVRPLFYSRYKEPSFSYSEIPSFRRSLILDGYFQSYKYFEDISVVFKSWLIEVMGIQTFENNNQITLHIRLGDIARNNHFLDFHGLTPSSFFIQAIRSLNVSEPDIVVITDDLELITEMHEELFQEYPSAQIINNSLEEDFKYLASSNNLVISNSTFSWWAAYLSSARIIAPIKWFVDSKVDFNEENFFPPGWVTL